MHKCLYGLAAGVLSMILVACAGNNAPPPVNTAPATTVPAPGDAPTAAPASYPSPEAERIPYPPPAAPVVAPTSYPAPQATTVP